MEESSARCGWFELLKYSSHDPDDLTSTTRLCFWSKAILPMLMKRDRASIIGMLNQIANTQKPVANQSNHPSGALNSVRETPTNTIVGMSRTSNEMIQRERGARIHDDMTPKTLAKNMQRKIAVPSTDAMP